MNKRFTVEEANGLLPILSRQLAALRDAHATMEALQERVTDSVPTNGGGRAHREFADASARAAVIVRKLDELGIVVRDPATGLIDFPSERDGHEVFLCWRLGEPSVAWWHPTDSGFAGRQPL